MSISTLFRMRRPSTRVFSWSIAFHWARNAAASSPDIETRFEWSVMAMYAYPSARAASAIGSSGVCPRSEEHTSELQSLRHLVCRLLLEKKKIKIKKTVHTNKNQSFNQYR